MTYTMTLIIDLVKIFNCYLVGCIVALMCWLFIKMKHHIYLKKKYKGQKIKGMWKNYINKDILCILLSWFVPIIILYEIAEEILDKLNRKYYRSYKYRRFKDILKGLTKAESLYFYFNDKYRYSINPKKKNIIYRIKKGHIICDNYSRNCWDEIRREINLEIFEYYFDYDAERLLLSKYRDFVINRLVKLNKNKVI